MYYYAENDEEYRIGLNAELSSATGQSWLHVEAENFNASQWFYADGRVPTSVFHITGNSLTIDIEDLSQLVGPDFTVSNTGYADLSTHCTMNRTGAWQEKESGTYTARYPQSDGTVQVLKQLENVTWSPMSVDGTVIGYSMPMPGAHTNTSEMEQGNWRSHYWFRR